MDGECDLDSLTALLEDSDMEDETEEIKKEETKMKDDDDDGCDLDEITAFLEQSESEEEEPDSYSKVKVKHDSENKEQTIASSNTDELRDRNDAVKEGNRNKLSEDKELDSSDDDEDQEDRPAEVNNIQAELLEMQRKMQELQERLANSQAAAPKQKKTNKKSLNDNSLGDEPNKKQNREKNYKPQSKHVTKDEENNIQVRDMKNDKSLKEKYKSHIEKKTIVEEIYHSQTENKLSAETSRRPSAITDGPSNKKDKIISKCHDTVETKDLYDICSNKSNSSETILQGKMRSPTGNFSNNSKAKNELPLQEDGENPFFPAFESKSKSEKSCEDRKTLEKSLFGDDDDDDSDWEPMEEDDKVKLSDEGHELSKLIRDSGKTRQSNVTPEEVAAMRKKAQTNNWKVKGITPESSASSTTAMKSSKENDVPCVIDPFSGIRIINPKISSLDMKARMRDRKLVKISKIDRRVSEHDNWVTVGVITSKTDPRQSSTGKTFCIWKLSDLQDCDKLISFFLFGEVYKQHWKNEVTSVVGILNPNLMDKAEKVQNDMAFTVSHPGQIMMMGYSKDFGRCSAMTGKGNNSGKHCTNFINKQQGEYCTFHVQRAYSKKCSQRTELQGSYSGMTPNNHKYKPKGNKDAFFFYQGQTYTTGKISTKDSKKKVTVDKLKQQQAMVGNKKVTTMSIHAIDTEDIKRLEKLNKDKTEQNPLLDMLTVPTPGSMNFVKHLITKDQKPAVNSEPDKTIIKSVTAAELLKQHKQVMRQRKVNKSTGGITLPPPSDPMKCTPTLGRGLTPGGDICLGVASRLQSPKSEWAKKRAIAKVLSKGGIVKEDPNAVKRKRSPEAPSKIKERIHNSCDINDKKQTQEPPRKKSKLLGNIDENSAEFKQLMKARSKHTGALAEVEAEAEERYFMEQEKKERLEDKMAATMEVNATVFTCKQCNYTAFKVKDECKQQNHTIVKVQTKKRFFKCKKCGNRTTSIHKLPSQPCKNCGEDNFERVSMLQERKGPKLPHEELCIRGDESKFIGAMNEKVYL